MTAVADARPFDVTLSDGRTLHAYEAGDPGGRLVVFHHGTPGAGLIPGAWPDDLRARGIRLLGFDRAGYGGSDRHEGRHVKDAAADTAALVDHLGVDRFYTWGVSGGGPHALACAALLHDRVIAAASLASVAPYDVDDLDFIAGMGEDNVVEFTAAANAARDVTDQDGTAALHSFLDEGRRGMLDSTPAQLHELLQTLLPEVDKQALTGDFAEYLHATMTVGLEGSYQGWYDDDVAFASQWGFDVGDIDVPLLLRQGEQDLMVPYAHGEWLAKRIPGVEARLTAEDGHLTLLAQVDVVHDWLMSHS